MSFDPLLPQKTLTKKADKAAERRTDNEDLIPDLSASFATFFARPGRKDKNSTFLIDRKP